MNTLKDVIVSRNEGKPVTLDIYWKEEQSPKQLIIFIHGFKGFKDWGHWEAIATRFVDSGCAFAKFNFSHNGTTLSNPLEFADLEAFGNNNYEKELKDLAAVIKYFEEGNIPSLQNLDICLIGHSRGGGIAMIGAEEHQSVKHLVTWAGVHKLDYFFNDEKSINTWKEKGVQYIYNARTKQNMPLFFQICENFLANKERFDLARVGNTLTTPWLIIQGTADPAVTLDKAHILKSYNTDAQLEIIEGADHVFGGSHPWMENNIPLHTKILIEKTLEFLS